MNPTRTGKIARLPLHLREELNTRLRDGQQARKLVTWLNGMPEVRQIIDEEFAGRRVREQNLSEWKKGGYRDWLLDQEAHEAMARITEESPPQESPGEPALTDTLARWLAGRYAVASRGLATIDGPEQWRLLRELCNDVVELRRGDHTARRLELERLRTAAAERDAEMRWKRKIIIGLETLEKVLGYNPAARAAFDELASILRHPFDPTESK